MNTESYDFDLQDRLDAAQDHLEELLFKFEGIPGYETTSAIVQARHAVEEAQYDLDCSKNDQSCA